jgi:uncharacterized membrane protein
MAGILTSILLSRKKLSPGVTHSALLSLITGIALVGLHYPLAEANPTKWEKVDNAQISVKLLAVLVILGIGLKYKNKQSVSKIVFTVIALLTLLNISIAVL